MTNEYSPSPNSTHPRTLSGSKTRSDRFKLSLAFSVPILVVAAFFLATSLITPSPSAQAQNAADITLSSSATSSYELDESYRHVRISFNIAQPLAETTTALLTIAASSTATSTSQCNNPPANADFCIRQSAQRTISAGSTSTTFTVRIFGDTSTESDETIILIPGLSGRGSWPSRAITYTIKDNDITPGAPTNISVRAGDAEATIEWEPGGSDYEGICATTDTYYVTIYDATTWDDVGESEYIPHPSSGLPQWHVDELSSSTKYFVDIYARSEACDGMSSEEPGWAFFTTNATSSTVDPTPSAGNKKKVPLPVRNLSVGGVSGTMATATWAISRTNINTSKRCSTATPQVHGYFVDNLTTDETDDSGKVVVTSIASVTLNGLTSGHKYELVVSSYSEECDAWSKDRVVTWTQ